MSIRENLFFRRAVLIASDMLIVSVAYTLAYWLRLEPLDPRGWDVFFPLIAKSLPWLLAIRLVCGMLVHQHQWSFRHASLAEAFNLIMAGVAGTAFFFVLTAYTDLLTPLYKSAGVGRIPRAIFPLELMLSLSGMGAIRFMPRYVYMLFSRKGPQLSAKGDNQLRTLIFGAGHTGELILRDLLRTRIYPYRVVGFIDDDPTRWGTSIHGCRVIGSTEELPYIITKYRIDKILIASPSIAPAQLRKIIDLCADHHLRFKVVPGYAEVVAKGDAAPIALKDLQLEDLLERDAIEFDHARMAEFFLDKTVLITGAAGSIGSEICRQVAKQGARKLVLVDQNENDLYFLQLELKESASQAELHLEIASIRERDRMEQIFAIYKPHLVFHAAAHKHVPLMEKCPAAALKNNVIGTLVVAECADKAGVERFVMISTDKAVRPTNVMGATKNLAEQIVRALNETSQTRFMAVRFGNVLGSNGSLVPILRRQIERGGPVTITHPKITRYFMTIPEAVGLVLIAAVQHEGTVCVLDMGEPLSVDGLARQLISLSGLIPDKDIPIIYTGLRPGEKMYEELFTHDETLSESSHPKIRVAHCPEAMVPLETLRSAVNTVVEQTDDEAVLKLLLTYVPGYAPKA